MIATERIDINTKILYSIGDKEHEFKKLLPKTSQQLADLIDEFKYNNSTTKYDIINFLNINDTNKI